MQVSSLVGSFEVLPRAPPPAAQRRPLSVDEWLQAIDAEGHVHDQPKLRRTIFYGVRTRGPFRLRRELGLTRGPLAPIAAAGRQGIVPELRREVWKYLLGYVPFHATHAERTKLLAVRRYGVAPACPRLPLCPP